MNTLKISGPRPRLIPLLLIKDGLIVRSQLFEFHQLIGNPVSTVERYSHWNVDELVVLDISKSDNKHDLRRDDLQQSYEGNNILDVLKEISKVCYMPLTFGGKIKTLDDIEKRLIAGADKVVINSSAYKNKDLITEAAKKFGSQCIVAGIDAKFINAGNWNVFIDGGKFNTKMSPDFWAQELQERGAGEIFLNSIDRDGSALGYDIELIKKVSESINIPVVAAGGAGEYSDIIPVINIAKASGVAIGNLLHFYEVSYLKAKNVALENGIPMRPPSFESEYIKREPNYDRNNENVKLERRITNSKDKSYFVKKYSKNNSPSKVKWCVKCTYPSMSAAPMEFDDKGVCTGCQMSMIKDSFKEDSSWDRKKETLRKLVDKYKSHDNSRHDVVVAVSGGKDSYFQVHFLKEELGLNPLLVTYDGNNWTDIGWQNLLNMKDAFSVDHVIIRPSTSTLIKLNKLAFYIMGDMNWHAHVGIMTVPMKEATIRNIPLVFYGEHGYLDLCGQFSLDDYPEVTYRDRLEHFARGFEWNYFVGRDNLTEKDMNIWKYPSDKDILKLDLRGIFLGNYVHWEANEHIKLVTEKYGFRINDQPFERTYRRMSNLDDMHENGIHDYLKYIKFGYGRATDHTSKDIRAGLMSREEAIKLVNHHDPIKSSDLKRWLNYVDIDEEEFDRIADTFRDPRVWEYENEKWFKKNIV